MAKKTDTRNVLVRLWEFQAERAPLALMAIVASLSVGVVYQFSDAPIGHYVRAVVIIVLYLIQIRTSDEKKDFEHDNKYRKNRPVQRGLVSLDELQLVNYAAVGLQFLTYLSFSDPTLLVIAVASQAYAYLTRKEFFVREWLRDRYVFYNLTHYLQLAILSYGTITILDTKGVSDAVLIMFGLLTVIVAELGRKMYSKNDTSPDTYSAALGIRGSAISIAVTAALVSAIDVYLVDAGVQRYAYLAIVLPPLVWLLSSARNYAVNATIKHSKQVEKSAALFYMVTMIAVILGA